MNDSRTRKIIQRNIFETMWEKAKRWCNENPVEKLEAFKEVNFHIGISEAHQTYVSFKMNINEDFKVEFDEDSRQIVGQWSLTWDKNIAAPVMLHFHSLNGSNGYYLTSNCKTFQPLKSKIYNQWLYDPKVIALMKIIFGFDYNRFKNRFTYNV